MHYECTGNTVVIQLPRTGSVIKCFIMIVIVIGFWWILLGMPLNIQELKAMEKGLVYYTGLNIGFFIITGLPLLLLPSFIRNLRVALVGRIITFDGTAKKIFNNNKALVNFSEIKNFNFQPLENNNFDLDCILHTGKKIRLREIGRIKHMKMYKADILDVVQFSEKTIDETRQSIEFGKVFVVAHYFILLLSILLIIGGLYAFFSSALLSAVGTTTTGTIIDSNVVTTEKWVESGRVGRSKRKVLRKSTSEIYTVEYQDVEGNVHTFETSALGGGGSLEVVYFRFWPGYAKVKSFSGEWGPVVMLLLFGIIFFFISQMFNEKFFEKMKQRKVKKR